MAKAVQTIIDHEGEGLVIRLSESPYLPGRNSSLFKLKVSFLYIYIFNLVYY